MISSYACLYGRRVECLVLAAAVAAAAGCASETGIVIEVTRGELALPADTLRFHVGVSPYDLELDVPGCGVAHRFVEGDNEGRDVPLEPGRDLALEPYRMLLEPDPSLPADRPLVVAVVALAGDRVVGLGALPAMARFVDGEVLSWTVTVDGSNAQAGAVTGAGCVCTPLRTGEVTVIAPADDWDCDGDLRDVDCDDDNAYVGPSKPEVCANGIDDNCNLELDEEIDQDGDGFTNCRECDDTNPSVNPLAEEVCDGFDNDCDGTLYDGGDAWCYGLLDDGCYAGVSSCNDSDPLGGGWQQCEPIGTGLEHRGSELLCAAFADCQDEVSFHEAWECAHARVFTDVECTVTLYPEEANSIYRACPGAVSLPGPEPADGRCWWTLMGGERQLTYDAYLVGGGLVPQGSVVDACRPSLIVELANQGVPRADRFHLWLAVDQRPTMHVRMNIKPVTVDSLDLCPLQEGFTCAGLPAYPGEGN